MWKKLFKVVSEQNSINDMRRGTMTFLMSSQVTDCITRFLYRLRHLHFVGCRVMSCLATTFCTVSTILVVSSRREAMSSLSCPVKSQHSRCSQSAATVLMTWCDGAPRKTQQQHKHHDNGTPAHDANMFLSPFQDSTQHLSETVQRRSTTNSNTVIGRGWSKFHTSSNLPVRVPRSCHCPRHR